MGGAEGQDEEGRVGFVIANPVTSIAASLRSKPKSLHFLVGFSATLLGTYTLIGIFDVLNPPTSVVLALFGAWLVGGLLLASKVSQACLAGALTGGAALFLRLLFFMMKP